ncbi:hypothetical protein [Cystobacter fuscus]|uniref:hypothetical protein n=1 Tax=Cystobacter fuscus TaxID=43 RepID=UPI002B2C46DE|nr:hypothetical protein F0U63_05340 [Cystobacter fuscus]
MTELDLATETLELFISMLLEKLPEDETYPPDEDGHLTNLSLYYRLRSIARYLATGDTNNYVSDLHRSGQTRLYYLKGCANGSTGNERFYRTSRNRAFFDCIAINDFATAEVLAELCDGRWVESLEYEDDFLFVHFLQVLFLTLRGRRPPEATRAVLQRFRVVIGTEDSPFFNLCFALQEQQATVVEKNLQHIMERRGANYARAAELGDLHAVFLHTERFIDVQAVAIVRMAAELGLPTTSWRFPRVPSELCELAGARHTYPSVGSWRQGA